MAWVFWLLGTLYYLYQFFFRTVFSTLGDEIITKFHISVPDLSTFFAVSMIAYALMQVPAGMLLDRFGTRKVLTMALSLLASGAILVGLTESYTVALLGRVFMGMGSAFGFVGTCKIAAMWFPIHMMGFLLGTTIFLGGLCGGFSKHIYQALPQHWDLVESMVGIGSVGLLLALLVGVVLREKKDPTELSDVSATPFFSNLKFVITNPQILLAASFTFFAYLPVSIVGDTWGPLAFERIFGATNEAAEQTGTFFYIAYAFGALSYSSLAALTKQPRRLLMVQSLATSFFLYFLLVETSLGKDSFWGVPGFLILSSLVGFNAGGVALSFPIGCSHASPRISATVVGLINMFCMISGGLFSKLIAILLRYFWDGTLDEHGQPLFSDVVFHHAFKPLFATSLISFGLLLFMRVGTPRPPEKL